MEKLEFKSPEENLESPNPLFTYLDQPVAFLIPDRSLSSFGKRSLKNLRVARSKWPLPGIFSCVDFAGRILKKDGEFRPVLDDLEAFAYLARERADMNLLKLKDEFDLAKKIRKVAGVDVLARIVSDEDYKEVLSPTLFGAIYSCLLLEKFAEESDCESHAFSHLEKAADYLAANPGITLDAHRFRPDAEKKFFILGFRDFYPAERRFLTELQNQYSLVGQFAGMSGVAAAAPRLGVGEARTGDTLLWISHLDPPGPLEAKALTRSENSVRVALDRKVRAFSPVEQKLNEDWTANAGLIQKAIDPHSSDRVKELINKIVEHNEPALAGVLKSLGFFGRKEIDRLINANADLTSIELIEAEDGPLIDPSRTVIWGDPQLWEEFLLGLSASGQHLKISDELEKILLAEGMILPRLPSEQAQLKQALENWSPHFKFLQLTRAVDYAVGTTPHTVAAKPQRMLSPSGLESLARCPLQFHFGREIRLPIVEVPDDLDGSALRRGVWIHGVLERINFRELKGFTLSQLEKILHNELARAFKSFASENYIKILQAQVKGLSEAIFFYLQKLELPLTELFPFRKVEREKNIDCVWSDRLSLKGRVDRLDFVGEGAFLWDYKTSNYSGTRFSTLIENGRFQWLLYREIFERDGLPIYGGGYLNPLDLKKSRLIFFDEAPLPPSFYDFLDETGVRVERVKPPEERELRASLQETIEKLIDTWKSPARPAAPLAPRVCDDCDFVGYCGLPFGVKPC